MGVSSQEKDLRATGPSPEYPAPPPNHLYAVFSSAVIECSPGVLEKEYIVWTRERRLHLCNYVGAIMLDADLPVWLLEGGPPTLLPVILHPCFVSKPNNKSLVY